MMLARLRTVEEAIAGLFAPLAPGCDGVGAALLDLDRAECRFPIAGQGKAIRFCGCPVDAWQPGRVNGSYCPTHRAYLASQPRVTEV